MEKRVRSLIKSVSWRVIATSTTMLLVFLFTGNVAVSAGVGSLEFLAKTVLYYLHERVWDTSNFGREKPTAYLSTKMTSPKNSPLTPNEDDQEK